MSQILILNRGVEHKGLFRLTVKLVGGRVCNRYVAKQIVRDRKGGLLTGQLIAVSTNNKVIMAQF